MAAALEQVKQRQNWEPKMHIDGARQISYSGYQGRQMPFIWGRCRASKVLRMILLLGAAIGLAPGIGADEATLLKKDFPILTARVKVSEPADYVIALDKSLSMKRFWPQTVASLSAFVGAIPDGDYVSILAFGDSASYLVTPAPIGPETRRQIQAALASLPEPTDYKTDLGAGVAKVLDELYRPGGNKLKFVFFLTDFEADPPPGSPYLGADSPDSLPWKKLEAQRKAELSDKILDVQAFVLNLGEPGVGRNLNLVQAVFPEMQWQRIDTPAALGAWFQRRQAEIARSKLRAIVRDDMARSPFTALAIETKAPLLGDIDHVYLTARTTGGDIAIGDIGHIECSVTGEGALGAGQVRSLSPPAAITPTGGRLRIPVATVSWPDRPWLASEVRGNLSVHLKGTWEAQPAGEIQRLDLDPQVPFTVSVTLPAEFKHGILPLWLAAACAAALALLVAGLAYHYRPQYLKGELTVIGGTARVISQGEKLKELAVGSVQPGAGVVVNGAAWRLEIRAFKTGEAKGISRGTYTRAILGAAQVQTTGTVAQPLGQSWTPLPKGAIIEAGGIRMIWS